MGKKSDARLALERVLAESPRPYDEAAQLIEQFVPASKAIRKRGMRVTGREPSSLSQRIVAGRRAVASQVIQNALQTGHVVRDSNGLLSLANGRGQVRA